MNNIKVAADKGNRDMLIWYNSLIGNFCAMYIDDLAYI